MKLFWLQARGSDPIPSRTSDRVRNVTHAAQCLNSQTGPNININLPFLSPSSSSPLDVDRETGAGPGPDAISGPGTSSPSFNSNGPYNRRDPNLKFINVTSIKSFCETACQFVSNTLPRQVYHNLMLLRLPAVYSSRVARIAELDWNSQGGSRWGWS